MNREYVEGFCDAMAELEIDTEVFDNIEIPDRGHGPWPANKTRRDLEVEFDELGTMASEEFGWLWLTVNTVIKNAILAAGVETWDFRIKWLAFKIAYRMCYWIVKREEAVVEGDS